MQALGVEPVDMKTFSQVLDDTAGAGGAVVPLLSLLRCSTADHGQKLFRSIRLPTEVIDHVRHIARVDPHPLRNSGSFGGGHAEPAFLDAVAKFQTAQGVATNANNKGLFGPATVAKANAVDCFDQKKTATPASVTPTVKKVVTKSSTQACLVKRINPGTTSADVSAIQKFLISQGYPISETGTYDLETTRVIKLFQNQYAEEILYSQGFKAPTGVWGAASAKKASALGLCDFVQ